jgi:hypothetical protein
MAPTLFGYQDFEFMRWLERFIVCPFDLIFLLAVVEGFRFKLICVLCQILLRTAGGFYNVWDVF